ncbi:hypothetical protein [Paenibacillus sp. GCM10028914]|uniref:hypothetical protein n=1 Tax=Paenibacillus sp. GCM10028914 TaxID=3273416 RepID=UPI0036138A67
MPWTMVHLAISDQIYTGDSSPNLLLGSISPDAIHMRGKITREDKGLTHLVQNNNLPAKEVIMEKLKEYLLMQSESEWKDFVIGYFSHIYTDLRWTETIYAEFESEYKGEKTDLRKTYNNEVSQLEFNLTRDVENSDILLRKFLKARGFEISPFVTLDEINQFRDIKVKWFQDPKNEPLISPIYFTADRIKRFISETSNEITDLFNDYNINEISANSRGNR